MIGRLYQGDNMPLVQSVDGWHEIKIEEDLNGFISADGTQVVTDADAQAADSDDGQAEEGPEAVYHRRKSSRQCRSRRP